jgi:hypothetical protein
MLERDTVWKYGFVHAIVLELHAPFLYLKTIKLRFLKERKKEDTVRKYLLLESSFGL